MSTSSTSPVPPAHRRPRRWPWILSLLLLVAVLAAVFGRFEYAYMPAMSRVINAERLPMPAYDIMGREIFQDEAERLLQTPAGRAQLSPAAGAIRIDQAFLDLGRHAFYKETFDNEIFLSDVIGALDGPLTPFEMARAVVALAGRGTTNLQVRIAHDIVIGGRQFRRGDLINTGIDVPRGAFAPIGFKTVYNRGRLQVGVTCAACHVAVDPASGDVIEGMPNPDLNFGVILALAPNSAAYFARTNVDVAKRADLYPATPRWAPTRDGGRAPLPEIAMLEHAVDEVLLGWPPGNFDTMIDLTANPTRIPDSFTRGDHPYGWTGFGQIGPFQGLSTLNNNVHAFNADPSIENHVAPVFFDMAPETYLAVLLQNAARQRYRYDPASGENALDFFNRVNPNADSPGMSQTATLPSFPNATALVPHGVAVSRRGHPFWLHINAMSAYQHSLRPPLPAAGEVDAAQFARGRQVFEQAQCSSCHSGPAFTNNRVLPVSEIGTEPQRAKAMETTQKIFDPAPTTWAWDTPVPVPPGARVLPVPTELRTPEEMRRIMGHDGEGGYKVKGLIGLRFSAPYLHMGDVAVGPDPERDLGIPGTLYRAIVPDAANSLRALLDRELRLRMIEANLLSSHLRDFNALGEGHPFWVDVEAGFSADDQTALIHYLLYLELDNDPPRAPDVAAAQAHAPVTGMRQDSPMRD